MDYVSQGEVLRSYKYVYIPKGVENIKMVYKWTSSGINDVLWATQFSLMTVWNTIWAIEEGNFMEYRDVGEIFPNLTIRE